MLKARNFGEKRSSNKKQEPLFPGYVFARINFEHPGWEKIKYTPGVRMIVGHGSEPVAVPETIIEEIQRRLGHNAFMPKTVIPFKVGDKVQFTSGPFEGLEGVFTGTVSGKERVKILLELLRQPIKVETGIGNLEKAAG
jgi:transcriptional antiterminator RfaH